MNVFQQKALSRASKEDMFNVCETLWHGWPKASITEITGNFKSLRSPSIKRFTYMPADVYKYLKWNSDLNQKIHVEQGFQLLILDTSGNMSLFRTTPQHPSLPQPFLSSVFETQFLIRAEAGYWFKDIADCAFHINNIFLQRKIIGKL